MTQPLPFLSTLVHASQNASWLAGTFYLHQATRAAIAVQRLVNQVNTKVNSIVDSLAATRSIWIQSSKQAALVIAQKVSQCSQPCMHCPMEAS